MKKIDSLIKSAKNLLANKIVVKYPADDDGFLKALGVDINLYAVDLPDGTIGYDVIKALNDTAVIDWGDEL